MQAVEELKLAHEAIQTRLKRFRPLCATFWSHLRATQTALPEADLRDLFVGLSFKRILTEMSALSETVSKLPRKIALSSGWWSQEWRECVVLVA